MKTMKPDGFTPHDVTDHLKSNDDMVEYLAALLDEGDAKAIAAGLGDVARVKGMSQIARDSGMSRESLYKALSGDRNPEFGTVIKVMKALGVKLVPVAAN